VEPSQLADVATQGNGVPRIGDYGQPAQRVAAIERGCGEQREGL
jgi:hypothetical protein